MIKANDYTFRSRIIRFGNMLKYIDGAYKMLLYFKDVKFFGPDNVIKSYFWHVDNSNDLHRGILSIKIVKIEFVYKLYFNVISLISI